MARNSNPNIPLKMDVDVDSFDVEHMFKNVDRILGPASLMQFLEGPGHGYWKREIAWNFEGEGSGSSGMWQGLSSATQDIRDTLGYDPSHPINKRTGEMFKVLTTEADILPSGDGALMILPGSAGDRYPVREKIKTAQMGRNDNFIPEFGPTEPRPVLGITSWNAEGMLRVLEVWFQNQLVGGLL